VLYRINIHAQKLTGDLPLKSLGHWASGAAFWAHPPC